MLEGGDLEEVGTTVVVAVASSSCLGCSCVAEAVFRNESSRNPDVSAGAVNQGNGVEGEEEAERHRVPYLVGAVVVELGQTAGADSIALVV